MKTLIHTLLVILTSLSLQASKPNILFKDDLGETTNLAAQHPEVVQQLQKEIEAFMEDYEANLRPIGWVEGYSEERAIETKRAMQEQKKAQREKKVEKAKNRKSAE